MASPLQPILCTGVVRSGSTWSFNVCRLLGQRLARQHRVPFAAGYVAEADLDRFLAAGPDAVARAGVTVAKAHAVGPVATAALRDGRARAVCTFRDPRDCVASDVTFLGWDLDAVVRRVAANLVYLGHYRGVGNTLFVRYEDMMADPLRQVARIAAFLDIDIDPIELRRVEAATGLDASRATAATLPARPPADVLWAESHRVDPVTQLHENHIHSGRCGRWRDEFPPDVQDRLTATFHPWLVELGYEPAGEPILAFA